MKNIKTYFAVLAIAVLGLTACESDWDGPGLQVPQATITANTTINELKTIFWSDDNSYIETIGTKETGEHYIIAGRVISSDAAGNVYKNLVIQDESGALTFSINANSMYNQYRIGQEIVVDATGMYIGKYRGLQQLGFPSESNGVWEATFMPLQFFKEHAQLNGLPAPSKIDTLAVTYSEYASASPESLRKYQSQLVRFNDCYFKEGGKLDFTDGSKITSNRTLVLASGDTINVRTSGYSNFYADRLPEGKGDVVGILSYYNSGNTADPWQLTLRAKSDLINFGDATDTPTDDALSVDQVIEMENNGQSGSGWVTGYIVGAVAPGTSTVTGDDNIEWTADVSMPNTLVIAAAPEVKNAVNCLVIELPQGSALRQYGNLLDNPGNYKKQIWLKGTWAKVLGTWGITGNNGTASEFRIEGVEVPGEGGDDDGDKPMTGDPVTGTVIFADCNLPGAPTEFTSGNFKFVLDKASGATAPAYNTTSKDVRLYANNTMTVSTLDGAPIDKMVMTLGPSMQYRYTTFTPSTGTLAPQATGDTQMTWTGHANKITFTVGELGVYGSESEKPGQIRLTQIVFGDGGGDTPDTPTPPTPDQGGTKENPYTVSSAIALGNPGTSAWVKGYIVGWADGSASSVTFGIPANTASNIVIAESASETNAANCIVVALPAKSAARTALNLMDNTGNLGKFVKIQGTLTAYLNGHGLTAPAAWEFIDGTNPDTPSDPGTPGQEVTFASLNLPAAPTEFTVAGYTIKVEKGSGATAPAYNETSQELRLYANNTMTVTSPSGQITSIVIGLGNNSYRYTTFTPSVGAIGQQAAGDTQITWTGSSSSVTFTVGELGTMGSESTKPGQIRMKSIKIG